MAIHYLKRSERAIQRLERLSQRRRGLYQAVILLRRVGAHPAADLIYSALDRNQLHFNRIHQAHSLMIDRETASRRRLVNRPRPFEQSLAESFSLPEPACQEC